MNTSVQFVAKDKLLLCQQIASNKVKLCIHNLGRFPTSISQLKICLWQPRTPSSTEVPNRKSTSRLTISNRRRCIHRWVVSFNNLKIVKNSCGRIAATSVSWGLWIPICMRIFRTIVNWWLVESHKSYPLPWRNKKKISVCASKFWDNLNNLRAHINPQVSREFWKQRGISRMGHLKASETVI